MDEKNVYEKEVSVVVPVYNAGKYLSQTLDSIIAQNHPSIEIVIVDDCSSDNSFEIVTKYMSAVSYINYYRLEKNSGVAIARNTGIENAKGRFIAFLDSDDIWEEGKLLKQLRLFDMHKNIPFTYTAISYIDENGHQLKGKRNLKEKVSYKYLLRNTVIATSTVIIDRKIVNPIAFPNRRSAEDYSLWLYILKRYGDAYGLNKAYTRYRKTKNSISSNRIGEIKYFYSVQTEDMHISKFNACINTMCYMLNAVKKHFF